MYSKGVDNVQSDCLSHLPLPDTVPESEPYELVFAINSVHNNLISFETVKQQTDADPDCQILKRYIKHGCPHKIDNPRLSKIKGNIPHMTLYKGCILYQDRVFVPASLRQEVLAKFHEHHPGMMAMKCLARELIWFPGLDKDIEQLVRNCATCQSVRAKPPQNTHISWPSPSRPWQRIHVDHFFYENHTCLIAVDSFSKYIEVECVKSTSATDTIQALRNIFSRNGLPDLIVSDNATSFTAYEFTNFLSDNGVQHVTSPAYMPACNGQAERGVKVIKDLLKKSSSIDSFHCKLAKTLLYYRSTPQNTTNVAPSVLLNGRKLLTAKDKLHPKYCCDSLESDCKSIKQFNKGDHVLALNVHRGPKWYPAIIVDKLGINVYNVYVEELDIIWKRHKNQLSFVSCHYNNSNSNSVNNSHSTDITDHFADTDDSLNPSRSTRNRRPPDRYGFV